MSNTYTLLTKPVSSRRPVHPGYFLNTRFLLPLKITQKQLAAEIGVSRRRLNEIIQGRRGITPDTALRLGVYFGNDAMFWMSLQAGWDTHEIWREQVSLKNNIQ